jgi:uncharacterized cupredoxin-like copper-binding protein
MRHTKLLSVAVLLLVSGLAAGCGSDSKSSADDGSGTTVTLTDYKMAPAPQSVKAGDVKITAVNNGKLKHEIVVVRADAVSALPKKSDGTVDEEKISESDKQGEVEDVEVGATKSATLKLTPGNYVLFCNIVNGQAPSTISHFQKGMSSTLTVTS